MKILTDRTLTKEQSPTWLEQTVNIKDISPLSRVVLNIKPKRLKNFIGYVKSLVVALDMFLIRKRFDVVITISLRTGLFFAFFQLFALKKTKHIIFQVMLDRESNSLFWRLKQIFLRLSFSTVSCIGVMTTKEIETYSKRLNLDKGRFQFSPFHTNVVEPRFIPGTDSLVFSGGRSGRDYKTLFDAVRGIEAKVIVVADKASTQGIKDIPNNVAIYYDIPFNEYMELLSKSAIVVITLLPHIRDTGTGVLLTAMGLGKPVIFTRAVAGDDYIKDGFNGFLVEPFDSRGITEKLNLLLHNQDLKEKIGKNALESVLKDYTFEKCAIRVLDKARDIVKNSQIRR